MSIGKIFRSLFGGKPPSDAAAQEYLQYQVHSAKGKLAASYRQVCVITMSNALRLHLAARLKPLLEKAGYQYEDHPNVDQATAAAVVVIDATPKTDARLHDRYDKILRIKKSMGKVRDVYCVVGRREDYKKYPRGTYPNVLYFCLTEGDFERRDADLPPEGAETIEGPRLFNFADLPDALLRRIAESPPGSG